MYHFKKEKNKVIDRLKNWENLILNFMIDMFIYTGYDKGDTFRLFKTMESILINTGECAVIKLNDELFAGRVTYTGELDIFGDLTDAIVYSENGQTYVFKNWRNNYNIVVVHNNYLEIGDYDEISRYASILADIDKSIKHNVIFSRYNPIPIVSDELEKNVLEDVFKNNENGKLGCMVSDNIGIPNGGDSIRTVDITDVKNSDKIQYLNKAHDDIIKRLCTWLLGIDVNNNASKMAQQSVAEITSGEKLSSISPTIKLKCRLLGVAEINKKFGTNINVTFSDAWDGLLKEEKDDNVNINPSEIEKLEDPTEPIKEPTEITEPDGKDVEK